MVRLASQLSSQLGSAPDGVQAAPRRSPAALPWLSRFPLLELGRAPWVGAAGPGPRENVGSKPAGPADEKFDVLHTEGLHFCFQPA